MYAGLEGPPTARTPPLRLLLAFGALLAIFLTGALFPLLPPDLHLRQGMIATQTLRSPRDISFQSHILTGRRQEEVAAAVKDVLVYKPDIKDPQLRSLEAALASITTTRARQDASPEEQQSAIARRDGPGLSPFGAQVAVALSGEGWERVASQSRAALATMLTVEIAPADVPTYQQELRQLLSPALAGNEVLLAEELVKGLIVPTLVTDTQKTQERRDAARAQVAPVQVTMARGQVIVNKGDQLDLSNIEGLREAGLLTARLKVDEVASASLLAVLISVALALSAHMFPSGRGTLGRRLLASGLVLVLWTAAGRFFLEALLPDTQGHFLAYLFPAAAGPMLIASFLGAPLGMAAAAAAAVLTTYAGFFLPGGQGLVPGEAWQAIQMLTTFLLAGLVGVFAVHRAPGAGRYLLASLAIAIASFLAMLGFWLLSAAGRPVEVAWMAMASGVAGMLSAMLTLAGLIFLGLLLGIPTRFQLLELAQLSHPLLHRLQADAPGTFHHSIIVGNLAEGAAHTIGADSLLVRVGSYYHDIGKLAQPGFYIENQLGGDNPHEGLLPQESADIIRQHVEQGMALAHRYRLPLPLREFIREHHGTRVVTYFYRQAAKDDPEVDPDPFTYPGPKPQSREAALVMLADSVEAVVRSSPDRSSDAINRLVDATIAERLAEGQLDECDLSLRDLKAVAEYFKASLKGLYHPRISYPPSTRAERERLGTLSPFFRPPPVPIDGMALPSVVAPKSRQEL